MSQVYSTEPATTGNVTLETSHGNIDVQLWCKECPRTCRRFLRLATDGYYDDLSFHRVMEGLLVQTGLRPEINDNDKKKKKLFDAYFDRPDEDTTTTTETMARIRFDHRGQVAWARSTSDSDDGLRGQFFVTLDAAPWLNDKHVVFGTVVGPTVFNALRIGRVDCDEDGVPEDKVTLRRVVVQSHLFGVLAPSTEELPWKIKNEPPLPAKKKKKKRKGKKDFNVLSFGNEEEEYDKMEVGGGMTSSHDVVGEETGTSFLSKHVDETVARIVFGNDGDRETTTDPPHRDKIVPQEGSAAAAAAGDDKAIVNNDERKETTDDDTGVATTDNGHHDNDVATRTTSERMSEPSSCTEKSPPASIIEQDPPQKPARALSQGKSPRVEASVREAAANTTVTTSQPPRMSEVEARRAKYVRKRKDRTSTREEDTLAKLMKFRKKVVKVKSSAKSNDVVTPPTYHGQVLDKSDDDDDDNDDHHAWMKTKFRCKKHVDDRRADGSVRGGVDDYVVIDEKNKKQGSGGGGGRQRDRHHNRRHDGRTNHGGADRRRR